MMSAVVKILIEQMDAQARGRFCPVCNEQVIPGDSAWTWQRGKWLHACTPNVLEREPAILCSGGGCLKGVMV